VSSSSGLACSQSLASSCADLISSVPGLSWLISGRKSCLGALGARDIWIWDRHPECQIVNIFSIGPNSSCQAWQWSYSTRQPSRFAFFLHKLGGQPK
jgi:hypothetical protein